MNNKKARGESTPADWRTQARALAMQCLAQLDVQGDAFLMEMDQFLGEASAFIRDPEQPGGSVDVPAASKSLAGELARLAWTHHDACDQFLGGTVKHWQLTRIALTDRAILRLAITELLYRTDVPVNVVIDQAIELSKIYSTAESPQFINGVLDAIRKKIQESEPAPTDETVGPAAAPEPAIQAKPAEPTVTADADDTGEEV